VNGLNNLFVHLFSSYFAEQTLELNKMKKLYIFLVIIILLFSFAGCSFHSDNKNAYSAASVFLHNFYAVSQQDVINYNRTQKAGNIDAVGIENINKKFKPLMTADAYEGMLRNLTYFSIIRDVVTKDCGIKNCKLTLTSESVNSNFIQYDYTAVLTVMMNQTKKQQNITESGSVQVTKQNGNWKTNYIDRASASNFFVKS
jgi:diacylglycerol kinase family enzyme